MILLYFLYKGLETRVHFLDISLKFKFSEILQWVLHVKYFGLIVEISFSHVYDANQI